MLRESGMSKLIEVFEREFLVRVGELREKLQGLSSYVLVLLVCQELLGDLRQQAFRLLAQYVRVCLQQAQEEV